MNKPKTHVSSYLLGAASAFDVCGAMSRASRTARSASDDLRNLKGDWMAVGGDAQRALRRLATKNCSEAPSQKLIPVAKKRSIAIPTAKKKSKHAW